MSAPREIADALESVVGIYFSDVRHRERAAFVLCDELVEMSCKLRAREHSHRFDMWCGFSAAISAPPVSIATSDPPLAAAVMLSRNTRNTMQHASAAATVDEQHCADAILDAVRVIERCWPGASVSDFRPWVRCALRIVRLFSGEGDPLKRMPFNDAMRRAEWRIENRKPKPYEIIVEPGLRRHWPLVIAQSQTQVEIVLTVLGIP